MQRRSCLHCCRKTFPVTADYQREGRNGPLFIQIHPSKYSRMDPRKQCVPFRTFLAGFCFPGPLATMKRMFHDISGERGQMPCVPVGRERIANTLGSNLVFRLRWFVQGDPRCAHMQNEHNPGSKERN